MDGSRGRRAHQRRFTRTEALLIGLMLVALMVASAAPALGGDSSTGEFATRPVLVRGGDTLWSLARANPIPGLSTARTVDLIREVNSLESSAILAGDVLLVPDTTGSEAQLALR